MIDEISPTKIETIEEIATQASRILFLNEKRVLAASEGLADALTESEFIDMNYLTLYEEIKLLGAEAIREKLAFQMKKEEQLLCEMATDFCGRRGK
jgi:hypothetical protein